MAGREAFSDQEIMSALFQRYGAAVRSFFRRRVRNVDDAEELSQELFASLSQRAHLDELVDPARYIFQSAANLLRDRARRAAARPAIEHEGFADPGDRLIDELSPERLLQGRQAYAIFLQTLEMLPERARNVFVLNRFEDMSARAIASHLGVSQRLVELDLAKALKLLRDTLP
jgi:RNA polymerase sigma factor (sigma-70 family)